MWINKWIEVNTNSERKSRPRDRIHNTIQTRAHCIHTLYSIRWALEKRQHYSRMPFMLYEKTSVKKNTTVSFDLESPILFESNCHFEFNFHVQNVEWKKLCVAKMRTKTDIVRNHCLHQKWLIIIGKVNTIEILSLLNKIKWIGMSARVSDSKRYWQTAFIGRIYLKRMYIGARKYHNIKQSEKKLHLTWNSDLFVLVAYFSFKTQIRIIFEIEHLYRHNLQNPQFRTFWPTFVFIVD